MPNTVSDLGLEDCDYRQISRFVEPVFAHLPDARLPSVVTSAAQRRGDGRLSRLYEAAVVTFAARAPQAAACPLGEVLADALDPSLQGHARHCWYLTQFLLACVDQQAQLADWDDDHVSLGRMSTAAGVLTAELVYGTTWLLVEAATDPRASFAGVDALAAWNGRLLAWMHDLHPFDPRAPRLVAATENLHAVENLLSACQPAAPAAATAATDAVEKIRFWRSQARRP